ncbi:tyrosine-type recombinase/integrase [Microbacterium lacticum]|uniref:tyrosine-type recombinase/integrase n=1 Tax=Microbacterium lacticum TaxID=33885 RepID=UPI0036F20880
MPNAPRRAASRARFRSSRSSRRGWTARASWASTTSSLESAAVPSTAAARAVRWHALRDQIATFADGNPLRFHDLRHTFLSRLARQGIAPAHIQRVAGHCVDHDDRAVHPPGVRH